MPYNTLPVEEMPIADTLDGFAFLVDRQRAANAKLLDAMYRLPGDVNLGLTSMHDFFGP